MPTVVPIEKTSDVDTIKHKNAIKKLITTGTNTSDLTDIKTINTKLKNIESIELKNITEVSDNLFQQSTWLKSFSAPEVTSIESSAFTGYVALRKLTLAGESVNVYNTTFDGLNTK